MKNLYTGNNSIMLHFAADGIKSSVLSSIAVMDCSKTQVLVQSTDVDCSKTQVLMQSTDVDCSKTQVLTIFDILNHKNPDYLS